jgi:hypothetical protein
MRDIVFVAIPLAFFGLSYLYVLGCDRIIGRDTAPAGATGEPDHTTATTDQAGAAVAS